MSSDEPTILYIDDDQDYLDSVRAILEHAGYAMREARTAEEGLEVVQRENPDLVLVDLMMEEIDSGTSFVREVRAAGNQVPIYMLSSVGDDLAGTADTAALGLAGVFQKPLDGEALLAMLRQRLPGGATR